MSAPCEITVYPNRSEIRGDFPDDLDEQFAINVPNHWFMPLYRKRVWDGKKHFLTVRYPGFATFPTGLLRHVTRFLRLSGIPYTLQYEFRQPLLPLPALPKFEGIEFRDYQIDAARAAWEKYVGGISVPTGGGKTLIIAIIAHYMRATFPKKRVIVLTHSDAIKTQMLRSFYRWFGRNTVGEIGGGLWEPAGITVTMIETLASRLKSDRALVKDFLSSASCLCIDEGHHTPAKSWLTLWNLCTAPYRLAFSGSFTTGDPIRDMEMVGAAGKVIYRVSPEQLAERNYLVLPTVFRILTKSAPLKKTGSWSDDYQTAITACASRNRAICELAAAAVQAGLRVLVLVKEILHGETLTMQMPEGVAVAFVSGRDPEQRDHDLDLFRQGQMHVLVATATLDEGVDVPQLDVVILAGGGKSKTKTIQRAGRALRPRPGKQHAYVIDFMDDHHPTASQHALARFRVYKEQGWAVETLSPSAAIARWSGGR